MSALQEFLNTESPLSSPGPASPLVFLQRGPVPGYPEGVWLWTGPTLPDLQTDLFLPWLLTVPY
jgi:hypothetical protein